MTRLPLRRRLVAAAVAWENREVLDGLQRAPEPFTVPFRVVFVVALLLAVLASCAPGAEPRGVEPSPLPPSAARPAYPWCPECDSLPNLGREPRVSGRVVYTITVERP